MRSQASAEAIVRSKSFARRRQRPINAKVLSKTQRRGTISNPFGTFGPGQALIAQVPDRRLLSCLAVEMLF